MPRLDIETHCGIRRMSSVTDPVALARMQGYAAGFDDGWGCAELDLDLDLDDEGEPE